MMCGAASNISALVIREDGVQERFKSPRDDGRKTALHATTREYPSFLIYERDPVNSVNVRVRQWMQKRA